MNRMAGSLTLLENMHAAGLIFKYGKHLIFAEPGFCTAVCSGYRNSNLITLQLKLTVSLLVFLMLPVI